MYGLKQAGHNWYNHLTDDLLHQGFIQSKVEKCLFIRRDCIILIYVDDCLIFSPDRTVLNAITQHLESVFKITSEDDVAAYLGINISRDARGNLVLHQPGLIDKVIKICGLETESNAHRTPADQILHTPMPQDPHVNVYGPIIKSSGSLTVLLPHLGQIFPSLSISVLGLATIQDGYMNLPSSAS
jgi:hypothetical protein